MNISAHLPFLLKAVVVGLALAFVAVLLKPDLLPSERPVVQVRQANPDNNVNARSIQPGSGPFSYADAVDKAAPAVVNIYTAKLITERRVPRYSDPVLEYFFGNRSPHGLRRRLESSLGSGVIISEQGYILTNNHVIDGASEIQVTLSDGRQMPAAVVGTDPDTDVAVLRVASRELSSIVVQNSDAPRVGDVVLAIGNPFGVGQTVTMGIVSATGRDKLGINTFEDFIQTDAAINPGNSGGALINARGELVGINTAIFSKSGGSEGIGFAIPTKLATRVMQQIIEHGHAVRGWLGIEAQNLTPNMAESFGLQAERGVMVAGVFRESPADQAGIEPGDIITHIDEVEVEDSRDILNRIATFQPGDQIQIRGFRAGNPLERPVRIVQRPVQGS